MKLNRVVKGIYTLLSCLYKASARAH